MTDASLPTKAELLARIEDGWRDFNAFLEALTEEQLTVPTDAAGWTAKDHVIHLAVWEDGIYILLQGQSRREHMGLDRETWDSGDFDRQNAVIQRRYKDMPLAEALSMFREVHERLVEKIRSLSDADLLRPSSAYDPEGPVDRPVIDEIVGDTFRHYAGHRPWIEGIVGAGGK